MELLNAILIGLGCVLVVETVSFIARCDMRTYAERGCGYVLRGGQRFGLIAEPVAARKPVRRELLNKLKDL